MARRHKCSKKTSGRTFERLWFDRKKKYSHNKRCVPDDHRSVDDSSRCYSRRLRYICVGVPIVVSRLIDILRIATGMPRIPLACANLALGMTLQERLCDASVLATRNSLPLSLDACHRVLWNSTEFPVGSGLADVRRLRLPSSREGLKHPPCSASLIAGSFAGGGVCVVCVCVFGEDKRREIVARHELRKTVKSAKTTRSFVVRRFTFRSFLFATFLKGINSLAKYDQRSTVLMVLSG